MIIGMVRENILCKLSEIGVCGKMFDIIKCMCKKVFSCVRANEHLSEYFECPIGLRQGSMESPLLFSLCISDLYNLLMKYGGKGIRFSPDHTEVKILMYADDVVLIADSPNELQRHITALNKFCKQWKMNVNIDKTKVMVFRKGGRLRHDEKWFLNGKVIECVKSYKYLGVNVSTGNKWGKATTCLAEQGQKALSALIGVSYKAGFLSYVPFFKIFDSCVLPILLYASEIWGIQSYKSIENIQVKACKKLLGVSIHTANVAAVGECGRYPIHVNTVLRCVKYWTKLLQMSSNRFPKICYKMLYDLDQEQNVTTWATLVKNMIFRLGFGYVWITQDVGCVEIFMCTISRRLCDIASQEWFADVCNTPKLRTYRNFKTLLTPEKYLLEICDYRYRKSLSRLRCSNHMLKVEMGRRENIDYYDRICSLCNTASIENEYHFIMSCPFFVDI